MRTLKLQEDIIEHRAEFSPCGDYRYTLSRVWNPDAPPIAFIGLNPSTATAELDDPTVRRCINFARNWGHGGMVMLNLFAYRATEPARLKASPRPVGEGNNAAIAKAASLALRGEGRILAAWGNHGAHLNRAAEVLALLKDAPLFCLGITASGQPLHPLYQPGAAKPRHFPPS